MCIVLWILIYVEVSVTNTSVTVESSYITPTKLLCATSHHTLFPPQTLGVTHLLRHYGLSLCGCHIRVRLCAIFLVLLFSLSVMLLRVSRVCVSIVWSFFIVVVYHCVNVPHWGCYQFFFIIIRELL